MKPILILFMLSISLFASAQSESNVRVEKLVRTYLETADRTTIAIGLVRKGEKQVIYMGNTQNGIKNQMASPLFEIGELSSLFTTTLLARMAITGEITIDTPVQQLLPGQRLPVYQKLNCDPVGSSNSLYACDPFTDDQVISILLCDLATHTAGFPNNPPHLQVVLHRKNPYARYSAQHLYKYLNNHPISFTSGFGYQYSHIGMALLGHSLALQSASSYEDLLQQKVVLPLQLTDTRITLSAEQQIRLLPGYNQKGKVTPHWEFDVLAPSAGIHSTIEDMLTFLSVNMGLTQREWLPTVKLAQNPRESIQPKVLEGSQTGLGWLTSAVPGVKEEVIWMAGQTGGFASYIGWLNGTDIGVIILSNQAKPVSVLGIQLLQLLSKEAELDLIIPAAIR